MIHSIPRPEHVTVTHGVLQSPDWWVWLAYGLVLTLAACFMPTGLRESCRALWEPWERWIASLSALSAILEGFACSFGVVTVWRGWMMPVEDAPKPVEGDWLAYPGFDRPVLT